MAISNVPEGRHSPGSSRHGLLSSSTRTSAVEARFMLNATGNDRQGEGGRWALVCTIVAEPRRSPCSASRPPSRHEHPCSAHAPLYLYLNSEPPSAVALFSPDSRALHLHDPALMVLPRHV